MFQSDRDPTAVNFGEPSDGLQLKPELSLLLACRPGRLGAREASSDPAVACEWDRLDIVCRNGNCPFVRDFRSAFARALGARQHPGRYYGCVSCLNERDQQGKPSAIRRACPIGRCSGEEWDRSNSVQRSAPLHPGVRGSGASRVQGFGLPRPRRGSGEDRCDPEQPWVPPQGRIHGRPVCSNPSPAGPGNRLRGVH